MEARNKGWEVGVGVLEFKLVQGPRLYGTRSRNKN